MGGGWHHDGVFKPKPCVVCGKEFKPKSGINKFCSGRCKGKWKYITGSETTETQYNKISGNWRRYYNRLVSKGDRKYMLTVEQILELHNKQKGLCGLTGVVMTCTLVKGTITHTNASIDRIDNSKGYLLGNIELVCVGVNKLRCGLTRSEYIDWCKKVADKHGKGT